MNRRQTIPKHLRYTIMDFNREFPDDAACLEHLKEQRFPGGIAHCEKCNQDRKHYRINGRPVYSCDHCGTQISPMAGTIFEHSSTSLRLWYYAMYLMASTRCGISAKQIQRETGVTYKTAWRMFRQIRSLLSETDMQLEGSAVEVDEMYYGGKRKGTHGRPRRGDKKKSPVVGAVERNGRVIARATEDVTINTLRGFVKECVLPKSTVFTDEYRSYNDLDQIPGMNYEHRRINHESKVYVMGDVHTNTIEGFWSLIKRGIGGVYHSISQKYLQSYLDEYSFRYNRRDQGNLIFNAFLKRVSERAGMPASVPAQMTPAPTEPF
ncbi:MAG TPA: IS1595 family transposase [Candidatus Eremiobacteraceae bacterium]|nr:IS1595 family transposase [Candidatus Eremiobacteraceae bacterium]